MFHQDRSRLNRENVMLTREINDLRRTAKALSLQQSGVERVRYFANVHCCPCRPENYVGKLRKSLARQVLYATSIGPVWYTDFL